MGCLRSSTPAERLSSTLLPDVPDGYGISPKDVATINEVQGNVVQLDVCATSILMSVQDKDTKYVTRMGGPAALVKALASSQTDGLRTDPTLLAQRKQHFGTNRLPEVPPKWFIRIWWGTLEDTLIRILIFGATVRLHAHQHATTRRPGVDHPGRGHPGAARRAHVVRGPRHLVCRRRRHPCQYV